MASVTPPNGRTIPTGRKYETCLQPRAGKINARTYGRPLASRNPKAVAERREKAARAARAAK